MSASDRELRADRLAAAMQQHFGDDQARIDHAFAVLRWARELLGEEGGDPTVVIAAALLHDVGIPEARRKYGSSAGRYQQIEGPPIARRIMQELGLDDPTIEHVVRIIGNHHTGRDIDTVEFNILWDADWLVNLPEEFPDAARRREAAGQAMRTATGRRLAERLPTGGAERAGQPDEEGER